MVNDKVINGEIRRQVVNINISRILPAVLKLQQSQQKTGNSNKGGIEKQGLREINKQAQVPVPPVKTGEAKEPDLQHNRHSSPSELIYLPLPLKCDYFKSALFYIRQYSKKADENSPDTTGLFMKLDTHNLGILWLALFSVPDKGLVVRFIADNQSACRDVIDYLPKLKAELEKAGYNKVVTSCLVQPNVRRCEDIDPAASNAEVIRSLIDWEV